MSAFPTSSCTAWEDCNHDGVCHDPSGCGAIGPNHRMTEGPPYASDNWDIQGYASPAEEIDDMANVGRSLIERIASVVGDDGPFKGWSPADDPAEIVTDMANWIAENHTSDWFAGDVDADGNELVTLRKDEVEALRVQNGALRTLNHCLEEECPPSAPMAQI